MNGNITNDSPAPVLYKVVIDRENQYSIWPVDKALPPGWVEAGKTDTEKACLEFIDENAPTIKYSKSKA